MPYPSVDDFRLRDLHERGGKSLGHDLQVINNHSADRLALATD
jgi:hypothetical protein